MQDFPFAPRRSDGFVTLKRNLFRRLQIHLAVKTYDHVISRKATNLKVEWLSLPGIVEDPGGVTLVTVRHGHGLGSDQVINDVRVNQ